MNNDPRYADINHVNYPSCSRAEAERAIGRILRRLGKKTAEYPAQLRDARNPFYGARRCWLSPKPTTGHIKGWGRLVHDAAHIIFSTRAPRSRPHERGHEAVEREVLLFCQSEGYFDGRLIDTEPTKLELRGIELKRLDDRLANWASKRRRADNAIRKLTKERKRKAQQLRDALEAMTVA